MSKGQGVTVEVDEHSSGQAFVDRLDGWRSDVAQEIGGNGGSNRRGRIERCSRRQRQPGCACEDRIPDRRRDATDGSAFTRQNLSGKEGIAAGEVMEGDRVDRALGG